MKKNFALILLVQVLTMAAVLTSCSDDTKVSVVPTLGAITFSPSSCEGGDLITATVTYKDKGEYCSLYRGAIEYDGDTKTVTTSLDDNGNITFSFYAPKVNRRLQISFSANVSLHAGNTLYAQTNTVKNYLDIVTIEDEDEDE